MPLPADVLPQLLHGSSVSGQSEAQRGLWDLREGTGEVLLVCVCVCVSVPVSTVGRTLCTMTMQQGLCANVRDNSQEHWCPNSKQSVQCHSGLPMGGMSLFVPCVTFPVIMLACLLELSLFGLTYNFFSQAFHCPSSPSFPTKSSPFKHLTSLVLSLYPFFVPPFFSSVV